MTTGRLVYCMGPSGAGKDSLLDWLHTHHGHLQDATLLRLFHELQHEGSWLIEASAHPETTTLQAIRVLHHPHRVSIPE